MPASVAAVLSLQGRLYGSDSVACVQHPKPPISSSSWTTSVSSSTPQQFLVSVVPAFVTNYSLLFSFRSARKMLDGTLLATEQSFAELAPIRFLSGVTHRRATLS
jgi:hypothetical protein